MSDFGDFFGAIGDMIGGAIEAREGVNAFMGREGGEGYASQTETYDRVLTGGKRELNINDV